MKFVTPALALLILPLVFAGCAGDRPADMHTYYLAGRGQSWEVRHDRRGTYFADVHSAQGPRAGKRRAAEVKAQARPERPKRTGHPVQPGSSSEPRDGKYPVAKKVPFKEGYVYSPYTKAKINVQRVPSGAKVLDPSSEHVFVRP
jgi:hypothetical protein